MLNRMLQTEPELSVFISKFVISDAVVGIGGIGWCRKQRKF